MRHLIEGSPKRFGLGPNQVKVTVQPRDSSGPVNAERQLLVTAAALALPRGGSQAEPEEVSALKQAMAEAGMDPDKYKLELVEDLMSYPGGGFVIRSIQAHFDGGAVGNYSALLRRENPSSAVLSIQHALMELRDQVNA